MTVIKRTLWENQSKDLCRFSFSSECELEIYNGNCKKIGEIFGERLSPVIYCLWPPRVSPLTPGVKYGEYKYVRQAIQWQGVASKGGYHNFVPFHKAVISEILVSRDFFFTSRSRSRAISFQEWSYLIFHFSLLEKSESYPNFTPFYRERRVKSGARSNGIIYLKLTSNPSSWSYFYWARVRSLSTFVAQVFEAEVW